MHTTPLVEYMTLWKRQSHQNMCGRHFTVTYIIPYHILSVTFNVKSRSSHDKIYQKCSQVRLIDQVMYYYSDPV